jgi:hypothetical protein
LPCKEITGRKPNPHGLLPGFAGLLPTYNGTVMTNPVIYITRGQVSDLFQPRFEAWYPKHAQDVVRAGFLSARSFRSDGFPLNCNIYEIESTAVFDTPAYQEMRSGDPFLKQLVAEYTYITRAYYDQVAVVDDQAQRLADAPTLYGTALCLLHFQDDQEAATAWFRTVFCAQEHPGILSRRLWRRQGDTSGTAIEWIAVIEWADKGLAKGAERLPAAAGGKTSTSETIVKWVGYSKAGGVETVV